MTASVFFLDAEWIVPVLVVGCADGGDDWHATIVAEAARENKGGRNQIDK